MKRLLYIYACAALLLSCTVGGTDKPEAGSLVVVGDKVPAFQIDWVDDTALADKTFSSPAGFEGKKTLLVLYNRSCGDCQQAMPRIVALAAEFPELQVVAIERASPYDPANAATHTVEAAYPALRFFPDHDASLYALFAEHTIPRVYFIDESALIKKMFVERLPDDFEQQVTAFAK